MNRSIKIFVDEKGMASVEREGFNPLEASIVITQVALQLQVIAQQQAGGSVLALPQGLGGVRLTS